MTSAKSTFNFCSGPAMLPEPVMQQAQAELLNYQAKGISIMEMSHRSDTFQAILHSAKVRLRQLMNVPSNYYILFMQGGASLQFSCVPMNLLKGGKALYLDSGYWAKKAIAECKKIGDLDVQSVVTDSVVRQLHIPADLCRGNPYSYVHYTANETIDGLEYDSIPEVGDIPLVADMSSCILSRPVDVSRFGLIYAGAQKNIGPAGLTVVIIREDILARVMPDTIPRLLHYGTVVDENSMANTPPTFAIYLADLVFEWLQHQGGVDAMAIHNQHKAEMLYSVIDDSRLYSNTVATSHRSCMNVPFFLDDQLESAFVREAEQVGLLNLAGHRSVGGCRASIYNAMPVEGVEKLTEFMKHFENNYV
ncbi:MAG: 3-phosphoserine/phosphohydroxythreonine transaminase [Reinekea sp.]